MLQSVISRKGAISTHRVSLQEAGALLPELIREAQAGEAALVKLVPVKLPRRLGTATGQVWMAEEFDAPLEDFKEYLWCRC